MLRVSVLSLFTILLLSFPLDSQEICLKDLIEKPGLFDNQEIEVEAEVLDIFANREGCWINISDNTQSLGAWVEKGRPIPYIEHFGSYCKKRKKDKRESPDWEKKFSYLLVYLVSCDFYNLLD
jgi:hypothetical protein